MPGIACPFPKEDALVENFPEKAVVPDKARGENELVSFDSAEPGSARNRYRYRGNEGTSSVLGSAATVSGGGIIAESSVTSPRPSVPSGEESNAGARARAEVPAVEGDSQTTSRKEQEQVGVDVALSHRGGRARKRTLPSAKGSKAGEGPLPPKLPPQPNAATRPVEGEIIDSVGLGGDEA